MTPALKHYRHAEQRLRIARAKLLLQLADDDHDPPASLADLLTFAKQIGDESAADSVPAFRAAQEEALQAALTELNRMAVVTAV